MDVAKTRCHHQELKAAIATIIDEFNFQFTLMLFQYCKKTNKTYTGESRLFFQVSHTKNPKYNRIVLLSQMNKRILCFNLILFFNLPFG